MPQPQTQVNIMVPAGGGATRNATIDLGHDPNGDPMLESTITQLEMLLRSVADAARVGKSAERNAHALHAKVQAFESMGMTTHMQGGFYPQQYAGMYAPPQGAMNGHGVGGYP